MAVPTSQTNRTPIGGRSRTNIRSSARCGISRAVANQIGIVVRYRRIARRLNIRLCYRGVIRDFLLKIANRDVERASGQQIRGSIVVARVGKLPVRGSTGEVRKAQRGGEHDKREDNDQRCAFGFNVTRMEEFVHRVKNLSLELEGFQGGIE
ncbi:MAG TPA: hypothetical protein VFW94_02685 [Candidatus Acidoferrales bacterium]|jgi:hypothetical protein|nr:hypothetical protein [Candidatus Acidoferrales bacterium]